MDRRLRGMTRPEYAEFLGYGAPGAPKLESGVHAIARWETEGVPPNSVKALSRLCGATGRRASFFRSGAVDEAPAPEITRAVFEALGEALLIAAERAAEREKVA